jgi:hypothetical protein
MDLAAFRFAALQRIEQWLGHVWTEAPLTVAALALLILLAAAEAALLVRARRRLRDVNSDLARIRDELSDVRAKYEREVQWRRAAATIVGTKERVPERATPGDQP